jgi:integrase
LTPLGKEEVKTVIDRCSPLYKAIFLTQLQGGIGVSEIIYFSKHAYKYIEAIKSRKVPLKIALIRSKTVNNGGQSYWTLVWDDAVDALANYLKERETDFGLITKENPLFLNRYGKPITTADIQLEMKRLREWTGLEKNVTGKRTYRFRPHEFRDTFKTWTANKHVRDIVSEFMMGHEVDANQYNKFAKTTDREKGIIEEMESVRPELNVLTNRGQKAELITAQKAELEQIKKVLKVLLKDRQREKDIVKTLSGEVEVTEDLPEEVERFLIEETNKPEETKELEDSSSGS